MEICHFNQEARQNLALENFVAFSIQFTLSEEGWDLYFPKRYEPCNHNQEYYCIKTT